MPILVQNRDLAQQLRAQRQLQGIDQHDEVWEGAYFMSPMADDEHQDLVGEFDSILRAVIQRPRLGKVRPGVNVSDRQDWTNNFRVPDVVVFLNETRAVNRDTFWLGGPDFLIEIVSEGDRSRDKLPFYAEVNTREILIVDRNPWALELYRLADGQLRLVGRSTPEMPEWLRSEVVPLTFRLVAGAGGDRPGIEMIHADGAQSWRI